MVDHAAGAHANMPQGLWPPGPLACRCDGSRAGLPARRPILWLIGLFMCIPVRTLAGGLACSPARLSWPAPNKWPKPRSISDSCPCQRSCPIVRNPDRGSGSCSCVCPVWALAQAEFVTILRFAPNLVRGPGSGPGVCLVCSVARAQARAQARVHASFAQTREQI